MNPNLFSRPSWIFSDIGTVMSGNIQDTLGGEVQYIRKRTTLLLLQLPSRKLFLLFDVGDLKKRKRHWDRGFSGKLPLLMLYCVLKIKDRHREEVWDKKNPKKQTLKLVLPENFFLHLPKYFCFYYFRKWHIYVLLVYNRPGSRKKNTSRNEEIYLWRD